jgi:hypothetical protein
VQCTRSSWDTGEAHAGRGKVALGWRWIGPDRLRFGLPMRDLISHAVCSCLACTANCKVEQFVRYILCTCPQHNSSNRNGAYCTNSWAWQGIAREAPGKSQQGQWLGRATRAYRLASPFARSERSAFFIPPDIATLAPITSRKPNRLHRPIRPILTNSGQGY